ncbi:hypothetical protein [Aureimonas populi]|uniref:YmiA family membrane protein n=1 Tax=Aureimonas populi TaxID=1701758 RepID=A0ABW5CLM1_9HYPH|nr:hypothetical protein [Aureimonas populi]
MSILHVEELLNPEREVPRWLIRAIAFGFCAAFWLVVAWLVFA